MFCTRCGKPLPKEANFCAYCGEPTVNLTVGKAEEVERKEEFRFEVDPEFVWDVKDFAPKRERIDEDPVAFDWDKSEDIAPPEPLQTPQVEEKTEEPLADLDTWLNMPQPEEEKPSQDEPRKHTKATVPWRNSIDKFYTFSQKNEEFQKLLDKEYEKLKSRTEDPQDEPPLIKLKDLEIEELAEVEEPAKIDELTEVEIPDPELAGMRKFDTRELNRDLFEIALSKSGISPGQYEIELNEEGPQIPLAFEKSEDVDSEDQGFIPKFLEEASVEETDPIALLKSAMPMAFDVDAKIDQALSKSKDDLTLVSGKAMPAVSVPPAEVEPIVPVLQPESPDTAPVVETPPQRDKFSTSGKTKRSEEEIDAERARILRDLWGTAQVEKVSEKVAAEASTVEKPVVEKPAVQEEPAIPEPAKPEPAKPEPGIETDTANITPIVEAELVSGPNISEIKPEPEAEPETREQPRKPTEKRKSSPIKRIVVGIIVLLLVAELGAVGVTLASPHSGVAKMIDQNAGFAVHWLKGVMPEKEAPPVDENNDAEEEEETPLPESNFLPITEGAQLVQSQLARNVNIESVTWNGTLAYDPNKDYGLDDLNKSAAIANNYWYTKEDGTKVAYDQEVAGTLIAFDSGWIDYVNNGDTALMPLLKEGGEAYENTKKFSKVKKMTEVFRSLQIGEVRVGGQGFYIWAKEDFEITEKGKTTAKQYSWIYYMEPVDNQMKIVKYIKLD